MVSVKQMEKLQINFKWLGICWIYLYWSECY